MMKRSRHLATPITRRKRTAKSFLKTRPRFRHDGHVGRARRLRPSIELDKARARCVTAP